MQVTSTTTGNSDWIVIREPGRYRVDFDVPTGLTISATLQSTNDIAGQAKTVKKPGDIDSDWTLTASADFLIDGPVNLRYNVASRSGNSDPVKLAATQVNPSC